MVEEASRSMNPAITPRERAIGPNTSHPSPSKSLPIYFSLLIMAGNILYQCTVPSFYITPNICFMPDLAGPSWPKHPYYHWLCCPWPCPVSLPLRSATIRVYVCPVATHLFPFWPTFFVSSAFDNPPGPFGFRGLLSSDDLRPLPPPASKPRPPREW